MPFNLVPAPATLDLEAPLLGRWFANVANPANAGGPAANITLPAPAGGDLGLLNLALPANTAWLPPALGTLSLYVVGAGVVPPPLAHLRNVAGGFPFTGASRVVAHFTLLPTVAERLFQLHRFVPAIDAAATTAATYGGDPAPTRVKVGSLAMVLPAAVTTIGALWPLIPDVDPAVQQALNNDPNPQAAQARFVGLALDAAGNLTNGPSPMAWLRRPGYFAPPAVLGPREDRLLLGLNGQVDLWAFDDRGRPIDPGAIAAWWSVLAVSLILDTGNGNAPLLRANGVQAQAAWPNDASGAAVVCATAAGFTTHLVNAHEGVLGAPFVGAAGRLRDGATAVTSSLITGTAAVALSVSAAPAPGADPQNPTPDSAPVPRLALLPSGNYTAPPAGGGAIVTLWGGGQPRLAGLARDYARVAAVDLERHLVGLDRLSTAATQSDELDRHRADQNRPSSRVNVAPTAPIGGAASPPPVLLLTADAVATAALGVIGATATAATAAGGAAVPPTRIVVPAIDAQWGPGPVRPGLGPPGAPVAPPAFPIGLVENPTGGAALTAGQYRVHATSGDGATVVGTSVTKHVVILEVQLAPALAGAWVRAWPLGFDLDAALHRRMSGGAGLVDAAGTALIAMPLPAYQSDSGARLGFDLTISMTWQGTPISRSFGDLRFLRPAPVAPAAPTPLNAGATARVCETAATFAPSAAVVAPPGATVVHDTPGATPRFALVDRTTVPPAAASLAGAVLPGTAAVMLTQPAYQEDLDRADRIGRPEATSSVAPGTDPTGGLAALALPPGPFITDRVTRTPAEMLLRSSYPFRGCQRLEVAAVHELATPPTLLGVIGSAPWLPRAQEQGPHHLGHPGAPAASDVCGTGATLSGPAATTLLEYARARTAGLPMAFLAGLPAPLRALAVQSELAVAAEATTAVPAPAAPAMATSWVAVLRTVARRMEGLPGLPVAELGLYPFAGLLDTVKDALDGIEPSVNAGTALLGLVPAATQTALTRAMDQQLRAKLRGARDAAYSLVAAIDRAEDLIYVETPALDDLDHGPAAGAGDRLALWGRLLNRLSARPGLRVVICVPTRPVPGTPRGLREVRDALLLRAIDAARQAAPGRVAVFCPGAGGTRPLYLASTTVIVDDVYALTGTTHLWRRGLTFDSSLACSVFDERVARGRCAEVTGFRTALLARRLGVPVGTLPDDPIELVRAIIELDRRGSERLAAVPITPPAPPVAGQPSYPTEDDVALWNPDGSLEGVDFDSLATSLLGLVGLAPSFTDDPAPP